MIELDGVTTELSVRKPSGDWIKVPVTENPQPFRDTSQAGIYTVRIGKKNQRFAVNLVSREESDIIPKVPEQRATASTVVGASTQETVRRPLWPYFVVLAFGLTLVEWYFWCRTGS
jgi:hypothetical protein